MTTSVRKRRVSLSLDADLVAEFEKHGPLSTQVNDILRAEHARRRHQAGLQALLDRWEEEDGPLDSSEDLAEIQAYIDLLG